MSDRNINGDINEILKKISSENTTATPLAKEGYIEFEIGFDQNEDKRSDIPEIFAESEDKPVEFENIKEEEISVPDIFALAEKEDGGVITDEIFKIQTVYIPRFTDASDDFHRLGFIPEKQIEESISSDESSAEEIDAIGELDNDATTDAKIVEVLRKEEVFDTSSTVFKFDGEHETPEAKIDLEEPQEELVAVEEISAEEELPPNPLEDMVQNDKENNEPEQTKEDIHIIEEPLAEKAPDIYVPKNTARRENITSVGDELMKYTKSEFNSNSQRDGFKDKFLDMLMSQRVRFFAALVLTLALFVLENLISFGLDIVSVFEPYPHIPALIDLQCALCLFLLALPEVLRAVKGMTKKEFSKDIFIPLSFLVYLIYSLTIIIKKPDVYPLFASVFGFYVLSSIVAAYLKTNADFISFKRISMPDDKFIVDNKFTRTLESENMALDGFVEEYKSRTARVFKTSFVADFFGRSSKTKENPMHILFMITPPIATALLSGLITYLIYRETISFVTGFALVFLFSLPVFSMFIRNLPHLHSSISADAEGGAIIGEPTLFEYASVDVIAFEDTEIFGIEDVNIQRIMLYGNRENLTKALRQMSALFMNVGGPLNAIFTASLDGKCERANGVSIYDNGIIGEVGGNKIMAGSYDFMISEGAVVPPDDEKSKKSFDATKIMYAAENGVVYAKFYIRYRFSEEFTMLMPILKDEGIIPIVYTRDPNVNNELLKTLTAGVGVIRILKKHTIPALDFAPSKVSAGMVFDGDKSRLLNLILISRQYVKFNSQMKLAERSAMIAGLVLGSVLSIAGMLSWLPPIIPVLWHAGWCCMLYILSKKLFKLPKKKKEKKKDAK